MFLFSLIWGYPFHFFRPVFSFLVYIHCSSGVTSSISTLNKRENGTFCRQSAWTIVSFKLPVKFGPLWFQMFDNIGRFHHRRRKNICPFMFHTGLIHRTACDTWMFFSDKFSLHLWRLFSSTLSFEHHSDIIKTRLLWSRSTVSYSMFFLSEGLCWKLHPSRESSEGKQPSWQQDVSLSAAEGGWPLLEQAGCDRRGCIQVEDRKTMHPVDEDCGRTRLWAHFSCSVQFPQPWVCWDGWDNGSHGADQSVLQPCGPESSAGGSGTRSVYFHQFKATPLHTAG